MKTIIEQANQILTLLSETELEKDIIELFEGNSELTAFLENIGSQGIKYTNENHQITSLPSENVAEIYLWYKRNDGTWVIKLWEIKKMLERNCTKHR